jgi:SlyX protein
MATPESRIEELEIRLTYQEATIQELSSQLYEQRQRSDRLDQQVKALTKRLTELNPGSTDQPHDSRPPHY